MVHREPRSPRRLDHPLIVAQHRRETRCYTYGCGKVKRVEAAQNRGVEVGSRVRQLVIEIDRRHISEKFPRKPYGVFPEAADSANHLGACYHG